MFYNSSIGNHCEAASPESYSWVLYLSELIFLKMCLKELFEVCLESGSVQVQ